MAIASTLGSIRKIDTTLAGAWLLEPRVFGDDRGFFLETYRRIELDEALARLV